LVYEGLAVGDAEFQKKCLGKRDEITKKEGRTILFVSHNMAAIQSLCSRCVLIEKGKVKKIGNAEEIINYYIKEPSADLGEEKISTYVPEKISNKPIRINKISVLDENEIEISQIEIRKDVILSVDYSVSEPSNDVVVAALVSKDESPILYTYDTDVDTELWDRKPGHYITKVVLPFSMFKEGVYKITTMLGYGKENMTDKNALVFVKIVNTTEDLNYHSYRDDRSGFLMKDLKWKTKKIN